MVVSNAVLSALVAIALVLAVTFLFVVSKSLWLALVATVALVASKSVWLAFFCSSVWVATVCPPTVSVPLTVVLPTTVKVPSTYKSSAWAWLIIPIPKIILSANASFLTPKTFKFDEAFIKIAYCWIPFFLRVWPTVWFLDFPLDLAVSATAINKPVVLQRITL